MFTCRPTWCPTQGCCSFGLLLAFYFAAIASDAQAINLVDEARADRKRLAQKIAAVDSNALSAKLVESADNTHLANWYAGKILVKNRWLTLEEAEQHLSADDNISDYRQRRERMTDSLDGHERLARWCQKQQLVDLSRVHWLHALRFQPEHRAALKELGLRWQNGLLLTHKEAELQVQRERAYKKQEKKWRARARILRRDLEQGQPVQQQAARDQLREIHAPAAVPALIEEFAKVAPDEEKTIKRRSELLAALGSISSQEAIEAIVSFAVNATDETVRYAALDQLKLMPYEDYVPVLLSQMRMPIEASVSINQIGNKITSHYSYLQETPAGAYESEYQSSQRIPGKPFIASDIYRNRTVRKSHVIPARYRAAYQCNGRLVPEINRPARTVTTTSVRREYVGTNYGEDPTYDANRQTTVRRSQEQASAENSRLARVNNALRQENERIAAVLTEVTDETLSAFPKSWWNWWSDYLDKHPDVANAGARRQLNTALLNREPRGLSQGTLVWTSQGKQPIEKILPGDYVLSQDPHSGELAYKPVLAIAAPRKVGVSRIDLGENELFCTQSHVLWITGLGWQRVSKLSTGQLLHGVRLETPVQQVEEAFEISSHDLIVEDSHTFFVGHQGLLVHDATPIVPIHVGLPGFSPAALAQAARLASE